MRAFLSVYLIFLASVMAGPNLAFASGRVTQLSAFPLKKVRLNISCQKSQTLQFFSTITGSELSDSGDFNPIVERYSATGRAKEWVTIPYKVFQKWVGVHGYTTADKIPGLMELDQSLSPARTSYFVFESGEDQVAIRMFNGSNEVNHFGRIWDEGSKTDSRLPLERQDPELKLPERQKERHQLIELGLLEATANVSQGMRWAFARIADHIDGQFNSLSYSSFGKAELAKENGLMIYAQTRELQVKMFERFGLMPVKNSDGSLKKLKSGLVLLSADAETFLIKNFLPQTQPRLKNSKHDSGWSEQLMRDMHRQHIAYMKKLQESPLKINHPAELVDLKAALQRLLQSAGREVPGSEAQAEKILLFFNTYFRIHDNIPNYLRDSNWQAIRIHILQAMLQADPFAAYFTSSKPTPSF